MRITEEIITLMIGVKLDKFQFDEGVKMYEEVDSVIFGIDLWIVYGCL